VNNKFVDLRTEALDEIEKEGLERLYQMMFALRQQKNIRESFEGDKNGLSEKRLS
jgi:hypothetical protein